MPNLTANQQAILKWMRENHPDNPVKAHLVPSSNGIEDLIKLQKLGYAGFIYACDAPMTEHYHLTPLGRNVEIG